MDVAKVLERLLEWLSEPKGRETVRTIVYLIFPIFLLLMLRSAARRRKTEKPSSSIQPKILPPIAESLIPTESLKQTKAREQKKISRELRDVFGREDTLLDKARKSQAMPAESKTSRLAESPESNEKEMLQEELLKLFSRRPK